MQSIAIEASKTLSEQEILGKLTSFFSKIDLRCKRILVVCEDATRTTPVELFFRHLLELLLKQTQEITVLFALGTHRPMTKTEMLKKLGIGPEQANKLKLLNHDASNDSQLVYMGMVGDIPLKLHKTVAENDVLIGIGSTIPHRVMGFSGGAKLLCPGIANRKAVGYTHWESNKFPEEEIVANINNPIRQLLDKIPKMIEEKFGTLCVSINCVPTETGLAGIFIGDFNSSYQKAAQVSRRIFVKRVEPCTSILATVDDKSVDFWQAAKAVYNCARVIKDGGFIVVQGKLPEGISRTHGKIIEKFGYSTPTKIQKLVDSGDLDDPLVASHMIRVSQHLERVDIFLSSGNITENVCRKVNLKFAHPEEIEKMKFDYIVLKPIETVLTT